LYALAQFLLGTYVSFMVYIGRAVGVTCGQVVCVLDFIDSLLTCLHVHFGLGLMYIGRRDK